MMQNDAGESHYIGNLWDEGYGSDILAYANDQDWPHKGWRALVTSFADAFRNGKSASEMAPPSEDPIGALWYRGMLKDTCSGAPDNSQSALDTVNYAIVVPASSTGLKIRVSIDDNTLATTDAQSGLNYAAVSGLSKGTPRLDVLTSDGSVAWSAGGGKAVDDGNIPCNFNFNVARLSSSSTSRRFARRY